MNKILSPVNGIPTNSNGALVQDFGNVPPEYIGQTANGVDATIQKGQLNMLRVRPQIINEHAESFRKVQAVVASGTIVGQIFKASQDNINGISLTLESAAGSVLDDFESYADSAALRVQWVKGGTNEASLETTVIKTGDKSMKMPGDVLSDSWVDTISSIDYTDYVFNFHFNQDTAYSNLKYEFFVGDGTNTRSIALPMSDQDLWVRFEVDINAMTDDDAATDMTSITKIGYRVSDKFPSSNGYVDNLEAIPGGGSVELKLWDMGSSIPVTAVDSIDDGTQYTKLGDAGISGIQVGSINLALQGGKRMYHIVNFVAGVALEIPANELLTVGNYYILTINYVDTDASVYGPDESYANYYQNGYAFTAPDEATAITKLGANKDLMFIIFSTQDVYVSRFQQLADASPNGNSRVSVFVEDENMSVAGIIVTGTRARQTIDEVFGRPYLMTKGSKFEEYYNDDFTDDVSQISLIIQYYFIPGTANG